MWPLDASYVSQWIFKIASEGEYPDEMAEEWVKKQFSDCRYLVTLKATLLNVRPRC